MRPVTRMVAVVGLAASALVGGSAVAAAQPAISAGSAADGEIACGYDYDSCVTQWYQYRQSYSHVVSDIYYRSDGYYFYWWS
ncbi:hypothetical protein AB0P21_00175 [Kribbella sp. NPDC056861]|uniref:hypothetical protein n=1 Tax=Kribbella sp. NPDC056861 TaxID=3154857 RepID=UPI0034328CEC